MDSLNDYLYRYYSGAVEGTLPPSEIAIPQPITTTLPEEVRLTSITANGKVTSPAAGVAIATTANLAAGTWDIEATVFISGTTAPVEVDNCKFRIGATPVATIIVPVAGTTGATNNAVFHMRINLGGTAPVSVNTAAEATTDSVYAATIIATRVI